MTTAEKDYVREKLLDHKPRWEAQARATLLAEVLQAVNDLSLRTKRKQTNMYATAQQRDYYGAKIEAFNEVQARLISIKNTETQDD